MANPYLEPLNASSLSWALGRALRYAIATAVLALILATMFSGGDAERLATTAYLAAIFAALVLAIKRFLPASPADDPPKVRGAIFPAALAFALIVGVFVLIGSTLVSQPSSEAIAIAACLGLIGAAALVRSGTVVELNAKLAQGGGVITIIRYGVMVAVLALCASALLSSRDGEGFAKFAYLALVVATLAVAVSLVAPTSAGVALRKWSADLANLLKSSASAWVFARTAKYAIATAVIALVVATFLPRPYSERFASTAYLAVLFAALSVGITLFLGRFSIEPPEPGAHTLSEVLKFGGVVVGFVIAGAAVVSSPIAEVLAVSVCVCLIAAAIAKRYQTIGRGP